MNSQTNSNNNQYEQTSVQPIVNKYEEECEFFSTLKEGMELTIDFNSNYLDCIFSSFEKNYNIVKSPEETITTDVMKVLVNCKDAKINHFYTSKKGTTFEKNDYIKLFIKKEKMIIGCFFESIIKHENDVYYKVILNAKKVKIESVGMSIFDLFGIEN
jgi:hypothetical protein